MKLKRPPKKIIQLEEALRPYQEFWDVWIISSGCFLKRKGIDAILLYRKHWNFSVVAQEMGISTQTAYETFNRAIRRLGYNHRLYRHWIADRLLENSGVYDGMSERDKFLIAPLHYHRLPVKLANSLSCCGETMGDILEEYGEKDFLRLRNFGKKKLSVLRAFLKQNKCLHLLKREIKSSRQDEFTPTDASMVS